MVLLMGMFGTAQPALLGFPAERPVFLREYSTNHYSVVSYFASRLTMEAFLTGLQVLVAVSSVFVWFSNGAHRPLNLVATYLEYYYILHDRLPTPLWHLLWCLLRAGDGKHGHRGLLGLCR
jgi:hypothetical protein